MTTPRDLAILVLLLLTAALVRFILVCLGIQLIPDIMIPFYCLVIMVILPDFLETLAIGAVFGLIAALIAPSFFDPVFLVSEPLGAAVCLGGFMTLRFRIKAAPFFTTVAASIASGMVYTGLALSVGHVLPFRILPVTIDWLEFGLFFGIATIMNGIIVTVLYPGVVGFRYRTNP